jgi:hypothetical protein
VDCEVRVLNSGQVCLATDCAVVPAALRDDLYSCHRTRSGRSLFSAVGREDQECAWCQDLHPHAQRESSQNFAAMSHACRQTSPVSLLSWGHRRGTPGPVGELSAMDDRQRVLLRQRSERLVEGVEEPDAAAARAAMR